MPWDGAKVSLRYAPRGGLLLRGHRTGRGGGRGGIGVLRAGGPPHFFVRPRVACVVPLLLWCVLRVPVDGPRRSQDVDPRGAWARLVGWLVPVSEAGAVTPCLRGGGFKGFVPPPPVRAAGRLRVPLAACPRRSFPPAADRPVTLGGRPRPSWTHRLLPSSGLCGALPDALALPAWERWRCASARCVAS